MLTASLLGRYGETKMPQIGPQDHGERPQDHGEGPQMASSTTTGPRMATSTTSDNFGTARDIDLK